MKPVQFFFKITFIVGIILSVTVFAQTIVDIPDEPTKPSTHHSKMKGCGFSRPLVVAGMIGNPPFGWVERHDERDKKDLESYGLGRVVLDKIAKKLGITYTSTGFLSYNKAIIALKRGDIDVLLAAYYRPQDLGTGTAILTPGYFKNVFTVYFKKGKEIPVTSFTDLMGWKGVIRKEENIYPLLYQKLPARVELTQVTGAKKAFQMLMNGEADYLITSPYAAEAELRRYKLHNEIVSASQILLDSTLFFVFSTNSDCLKLKQKFSDLLREDDFSAPKISEMAHQLVDEWGEKFREETGLLNASDDDQEISEEN